VNERAAPEMHSAICGAPAACDELESALQWRAGALVNPRPIAHNSRSAQKQRSDEVQAKKTSPRAKPDTCGRLCYQADAFHEAAEKARVRQLCAGSRTNLGNPTGPPSTQGETVFSAGGRHGMSLPAKPAQQECVGRRHDCFN
jgi:hypothetical protein